MDMTDGQKKYLMPYFKVLRDLTIIIIISFVVYVIAAGPGRVLNKINDNSILFCRKFVFYVFYYLLLLFFREWGAAY